MTENSFSIDFFLSGGLITNYHCTSACKHCLYKCSPKREKNYIDPKIARDNIIKIQSKACHSIHIGGGEPFLNVDKLAQTLQIARKEKMNIEYVETNSSWFTTEKSAIEILLSLKKSGLSTLLVSISPFHNEFIPFYKIKGVIAACHKTGIGIFPWTENFINDLQNFDEYHTHSLDEYAAEFGNQYIASIPSRYWIHFGGRAIETYKKYLPLKKTSDITGNSMACIELVDTSHFHVDLYGKYIPGLCSGFGIDIHDLDKPLDPQKYPLIHILRQKGIKGLYDMAVNYYQFIEKDKYLNKCHLCLDIRKFLLKQEEFQSVELHPFDFYQTL